MNDHEQAWNFPFEEPLHEVFPQLHAAQNAWMAQVDSLEAPDRKTHELIRMVVTVSLRNPGRFRSTSAFAPIVSPINCPWGQKALTGYLGEDIAAWRAYDACALIKQGARLPELLVDQGTADNFLDSQLKTHLLDEACRNVDMAATIRLQEGYDHSYCFVSTFMAEHVAWHAERLKA